MDVNAYDDQGRTPLMNAAIEGNVEEVRRLLQLGADPALFDKPWGTTTAVNFAGRRAKESAVHREIEEILLSARPVPVIEAPPKHNAPDRVQESGATSWPYESVRMKSGATVVRIKASAFYWGALGAFVGGVYLLLNDKWFGATLILTATPCLLLYPAARALFGGKDSVAAAVTTVVVEEFLKSELKKSIEQSSKKKRRGG